jgi:hypothetical protein
MKKASIVVDPFFNNNKLFNLDDPSINRDNCLYLYSALKDSLAKEGFDLATADIHSPSESDLVIYNEAPKKLPNDHAPEKSLLLLFETELIKPQNWNLKLHRHFKKVFTWNDDFVDNQKYFKINFSHQFPERIRRVDFDKRKFCTLIAGNKMSKHPKELYSQRLRSIRWFEKHHPEDFDYYGMGWDRIQWSSPWINKVFRKLKLEKWFRASASPCYCGPVHSKTETLQNYKFSICYENAQKIPGYITEKIFDSFFAGCVPVYWGAPNITDFIPSTCFIDRTQFKSHEELYNFLKSLTPDEFNGYLNSIEAYLNSPSAVPFTALSFSQQLSGHV